MLMMHRWRYDVALKGFCLCVWPEMQLYSVLYKYIYRLYIIAPRRPNACLWPHILNVLNMGLVSVALLLVGPLLCAAAPLLQPKVVRGDAQLRVDTGRVVADEFSFNARTYNGQSPGPTVVP